MCEVYRNRTIYLGFVLWLLAAIPLANIDHIYEAMGQEKEVAEYATRWIQLVFPFFFFEVITTGYHSFAGY